MKRADKSCVCGRWSLRSGQYDTGNRSFEKNIENIATKKM